jgi:hypothetical protein
MHGVGVIYSLHQYVVFWGFEYLVVCNYYLNWLLFFLVWVCYNIFDDYLWEHKAGDGNLL